ncbi:hypothetical protein [Methanobacterium sp.]|uniref:hypothetical protein n=1 Tax=Methanobacterium sp. TaxID=2164 RepID=UPI003C7085AC
MQLPIAKPVLIAIVAIIAVIGVGAGVMMGTQNQANMIQPVPSQTQDQLNDSEMMENLNKSPEELSDDQKGYQGTEDISSEYQGPELTQALNIVKTHPAHPIKPKPPVKPNNPPANNDNNDDDDDQQETGDDDTDDDNTGDDDTGDDDTGDEQIEEPWDPLEDPGENPDNDGYDDDGSDSGEDETGGEGL